MTEKEVIVRGKEMEEVSRESLNQMFWNSIEQYSELEAVKYRVGDEFLGYTYGEFGDKVRQLAQGLMSLGIKKEDKVSLLSETRWEWVLADFAILTAAGITVTIYPTLPSSLIKHIVQDSDSVAIILENQEQLDRLMEVVDDLEELKYIITIEETTRDRENILTLEEVMEKGKDFQANNPGLYEERWKSVAPDDLSSIVYTSGTTGLPKGTMLSHWNWRFNFYSVTQVFTFGPGDRLLAFLPLAHAYMRCVCLGIGGVGATTYFSLPERLAEDLPVVKPTAFVSVPRLFERVYQRILDQMEDASALRRRIFFWAASVAREIGKLQGKAEPVPAGLRLKHKLADRLVFSKLRKRMGVDQLRCAVSGGSALTKDLAYFFNGAGIIILEGYGMTENAAPANICPIEQIKPGTVGPPIPGTMEKIAEDGEILIKGDHVMKGYYKLPEETREVITEDGWLRTGDMGHFDEDGYLVFKERKKHLLVLSTGKNVAPLPMEDSLKKSAWIDEAIVIGDDRKFTSALIWPNYQLVLKYARENDINFDESLTEYETGQGGEEVPARVDSSLLENDLIRDIIENEAREAIKEFASYEQPKKFALVNQSLSVERGEITPTFKLKRKVIISKYSDLIEEIYQS